VLVQLQHHDVNDAIVARASLEEIEAVRKNIAWRFTWVSSYHSDFDYDFNISFLPEQIAAARVTAWKISSATACTSPTTWANVMARSNHITIHVPRELRAYCKGASELMLSAPSVRAVLDELERQHPSLYRGICDDTGAVRRHVNVFVNKDHMRDRDGLDTALFPGDEIIILPAVSGG
jgi:molybdopterin synthase sulfur carrier subunit